MPYYKLNGLLFLNRCLKVDQVVSIYEGSLRGNFQVSGCDDSLTACAVNYLLVGAMRHRRRVSLFKELMSSKMASDFADDVSKALRAKLLEAR